MSLEEELNELSEPEQRCFKLVATLVGGVASHYNPEDTQKAIDLLARYSQVVRSLCNFAESVAEDHKHHLDNLRDTKPDDTEIQ